jgi:hypothetical protein
MTNDAREVAPIKDNPLWAPKKMYVQFAENGNIRKWTSGPSNDADHMHSAKVYVRLDGDFAALILAGNKILDAIDTYDSEKKPLPSNHPDVHAFSGLLDKMPVADTHAMAPDLAARVLELEAENKRLREAIADARLIAVDAQLRATYQKTALERISDLLRQALNKEPTP